MPGLGGGGGGHSTLITVISPHPIDTLVELHWLVVFVVVVELVVGVVGGVVVVVLDVDAAPSPPATYINSSNESSCIFVVP